MSKQFNRLRKQITTFKGLNRQPVIYDGEFTECLNVDSSTTPVLTVRQGRSVVADTKGTPQGMVSANGELYYIVSGKMYKLGQTEPLCTLEYKAPSGDMIPLSEGVKQMVEMHDRILIFPDKMYFNLSDNTANTLQYADTWKEYKLEFAVDVDPFLSQQKSIRTENCYWFLDFPYTVDGNTETFSLTLVTTILSTGWQFNAGDYFIYDTLSGKVQFYKDGEKLGDETGNKYFKINEICLDDTYDSLKEDCLGTGDMAYTSYVHGQIINAFHLPTRDYFIYIGTDYVLEDGTAPYETKYEYVAYPNNGGVPDLDYICLHNNRIVGVKDNTIYVSSLGNAMGIDDTGNAGWTWFIDDDGNIADMGSYAVDVASDGPFTGVCSWNNRVIALKERMHYELYGDYPSNFTLTNVSKIGTIANSSMREVSSAVFYVNRNGVWAYSGGTEQMVSKPLAQGFTNAVCGTDGIRYYLSNNNNLYVFNTGNGYWTEEDLSIFGEGQYISNFCDVNDVLYAQSSTGEIICINPDVSEDVPEWSFTITNDTISSFDNKVISELKIKVKSLFAQTIKLEVSIDGQPYEEVDSAVFDNLRKVQTLKCGIKKGNDFKLRLSGIGKCYIYGVQYTYYEDGDYFEHIV